MFLLATGICACAGEPAEPVLLVVADRSYLGGDVALDGQEIGALGEYMFNTGLMGAALNAGYPSSPLRDLVGANLDLAHVVIGVHSVSVHMEGLPDLVVEFELPFRGEDNSCMVLLLPTYRGAGSACEVRRGAALGGTGAWSSRASRGAHWLASPQSATNLNESMIYKPSIRLATVADAAELARLLSPLGYPATAGSIGAVWEAWAVEGNSALVIQGEDSLLGAITIHRMVVLHRAKPVGRITSLVVDPSARGQGKNGDRHRIFAYHAVNFTKGCPLLEIRTPREIPGDE